MSQPAYDVDVTPTTVVAALTISVAVSESCSNDKNGREIRFDVARSVVLAESAD